MAIILSNHLFGKLALTSYFAADKAWSCEDEGQCFCDDENCEMTGVYLDTSIGNYWLSICLYNFNFEVFIQSCKKRILNLYVWNCRECYVTWRVTYPYDSFNHGQWSSLLMNSQVWKESLSYQDKIEILRKFHIHMYINTPYLFNTNSLCPRS